MTRQHAIDQYRELIAACIIARRAHAPLDDSNTYAQAWMDRRDYAIREPDYDRHEIEPSYFEICMHC